MKRLRYVFLSLMAILIAITQPVSINLDYFNTASASTNVATTAVTTAATAEGAACGNPNAAKQAIGQKKFKDAKVTNQLKNQIKELHKAGESYYDSSDFNWNELVSIDYGNGELALTAPLKNDVKKQGDVFRSVSLFTAYDENNNEIKSSMLIQGDTTLDMKFVEITYRSLDNEPIVGLKVDREQETIEKLTFDEEKEVSLLSVNTASAGYWENVGKCIKTYWDSMPGWVKFLCEGACSTVIWGANPISVTGCASCLGAWGYACLLSA